MARDDYVKNLIFAVERAGVSKPEVNLETRPPCVAPRALDHPRRKINSGDCMPELGESKGEEPCSRSDIEDSVRSS